MAATRSGDGPFGPGLPRRFGEKSCRYFRFTNAEWKARRVEGFSTLASVPPPRGTAARAEPVARIVGVQSGTGDRVVSCSSLLLTSVLRVRELDREFVAGRQVIEVASRDFDFQGLYITRRRAAKASRPGPEQQP